MKRFLILALFLFTPPAFARHDPPEPDEYTQVELLKNWTMSTCLSDALGKKYQSKGSEEDALQTAGAYFEFSKLDVEHFEELNKLIIKYMSRTYGGSTGAAYQSMKCIDLFNSKELV